MSMDVDINTEDACVIVSPDYGRRVTFEVRRRTIDISSGDSWRSNRKSRFVVGIKGSEGRGFSHHVSFEAAIKSVLYRARRYDKAYSKPRGIQARREIAA